MGNDSAWGSTNRVFGEGRYGEILLNQGGNLQTKDGDDIGFAEHGLVIRANDPADTITMIPWENVRMIRTSLTQQAMRKQKTIGLSENMKVIDRPAKELSDGSS